MQDKIDTAVIIIDMQRDFVDPDGACCVAGAAATVPAIKKLADEGRKKGWRIVHVVRSHDKSGADAEPFRAHLFSDGAGYAVSHSDGARIVDELTPQKGDVVVCKVRFSGFFATKLDLVLRGWGVRRLVVCGTQYPNCVRATAVDGISLDYEVVVCTDASSAATPEVARANIHDLENMGIRCLDLESTLRL